MTGYELALARSNAVRPDSADLDPLRDLAARGRMTVVVGAPVLNDQDKLHIAALAIHPYGSVVLYTKNMLRLQLFHSLHTEVPDINNLGKLLSLKQQLWAPQIDGF